MNLAGEGSKGGVVPGELADYLRYGVRGLSTMPPAAPIAEASRPWFRRLRELAAEHGLARALDGHDAGLRCRRRGGSDVRSGSAPSSSLSYRAITIQAMSLGDLWSRTLVYFGIAEEDEDYYEDEEGFTAEERSSRATASGRTSAG